MRTLRIPIVVLCVMTTSSGLTAKNGKDPGSWKIPSSREHFHLFLLMGQSNMSGGVNVATGDDKPVPRVVKMRLVKEGMDPKWEPGAHPLHPNRPGRKKRYGLGTSFARTYVADKPGAMVGLIPMAWGGKGISQLNKGSTVYRNAIRHTKAAMQAGTLKGVLWHQGESDTVRPCDTDAYERRLHRLIEDVRKDLGDPDLPFIVGNLAEFYGTGKDHSKPDRVKRINQVRSVLRELPDKVPNTGFAESTGCSSPDHHMVHFDRKSYDILGKRYAEIYAKTVARARETPRSNFVFILADDLGWADIGCYGSTFHETPHLDRLAAEGMRFTEAYAAAPICSPTRASILTGKYPARTDTTEWFGGPQPDRYKRNTPLRPAPYRNVMALEEQTLAETMKDNGYATFFAGKWHLGHKGFWPEEQGFDINKGGHTAGGPYGGKKYFSPYGNPRLEDGPDGEHLPDRLASETARFIEANKNRPFFAYLSFYSVHGPFISRDDLKRKYQEKDKPTDQWGQQGGNKVRLVQNHAVYAGMVEAMDQAVGKVIDKLAELGLDRNTVVFFMSDNGGVATGPCPTSNMPLRGGKGWLYEGGIREPMIIRSPGVVTAGAACSVPVTSTDFYPTILELAGIEAVPDQHTDGVSLVPLLRGSSTLPRQAIYWHYPHYSGGLGGPPSAAVRSGDWKLIEFFEDRRVELYNLAGDMGEKSELSQAHPDKVKALREMLHKWQKGVDAKFPTPNPNFKKP
jgi:arylsulfatase A-like enzyme